MKDDRKAVYETLDVLPDAVFAALLLATQGVNKVLCLTCIDDPTPNAAYDEAIKPWIAKLG